MLLEEDTLPDMMLKKRSPLHYLPKCVSHLVGMWEKALFYIKPAHCSISFSPIKIKKAGCSRCFREIAFLDLLADARRPWACKAPNDKNVWIASDQDHNWIMFPPLEKG